MRMHAHDFLEWWKRVEAQIEGGRGYCFLTKWKTQIYIYIYKRFFTKCNAQVHVSKTRKPSSDLSDYQVLCDKWSKFTSYHWFWQFAVAELSMHARLLSFLTPFTLYLYVTHHTYSFSNYRLVNSVYIMSSQTNYINYFFVNKQIHGE